MAILVGPTIIFALTRRMRTALSMDAGSLARWAKFRANYVGVVAGMTRRFLDFSEKYGVLEREANIIADLPRQYGKPEEYRFYKGDPNNDIQSACCSAIFFKFFIPASRGVLFPATKRMGHASDPATSNAQSKTARPNSLTKSNSRGKIRRY